MFEHIGKSDERAGIKPPMRPFRYRRLKRIFFDEAWELEELLVTDPRVDEYNRHIAMANFYRMKRNELRHSNENWLLIAMGGLTVAVIMYAIGFFL